MNPTGGTETNTISASPTFQHRNDVRSQEPSQHSGLMASMRY